MDNDTKQPLRDLMKNLDVLFTLLKERIDVAIAIIVVIFVGATVGWQPIFERLMSD